MSTESKPIPFYQLMDAFEAFSHSEPSVKPQHRSLYYFLIGYARKRGNVPRFTLPYEVGMHGSSIGSWATYDAAIKALAGWGFIVYTPGANRYKVPIVELTFRNPNDDELLGYWQAYCLAHPVELQNQNPSAVIELQNLSPIPSVELQNCISTANPSGDIKKSIRDREDKSAASAATHPSSFSGEEQEKPKTAARPKKSAAHADEVAALKLPHPGAEFAELWAEFRAMPKQVKKPVTSLRRLLVTLGKYEEGFAQLMLEKAIEGNWSGVEFDGTAKTYAEWRAAQAERARRQPTRTNSPTGEGPEPNQEFLDEVAARKQAEEDAHFARWHVPSPVVDPNKEFGYVQSAEEGLAQARATPEYQQYLAELEAAKKQAATDAEPEPPAPSPENPSDSPPQAA